MHKAFPSGTIEAAPSKKPEEGEDDNGAKEASGYVRISHNLNQLLMAHLELLRHRKARQPKKPKMPKEPKKAKKQEHLAISHNLNQPLMANLELLRQTNPQKLVVGAIAILAI